MTFGLTSFGSLIGLYAQFKPLYVHMERLQNVLSLPSEYESGLVPAFDEIDRMEFSGVVFKHDQQEDVLLNDINVSAARGRIIAIVGPSGGGKTTMGYLATGVFKPIDGKIAVNGADARGLSMKWYRNRVALVNDNDFIFTDTVRENLKIVRPDATDDELQHCLHMSLLNEVVAELPKGLDTLIGRTGVTLSSGQRQRLSLARAILRDPEVVVLDEITSNLDTELEEHLHERLEEWMRKRVALLIAHRPSTIAWADTVFELRDGRLAERTTPYTGHEPEDGGTRRTS
jgi:ABC-type multidrug transport system fused ATPase/permease subunit